MKLTTVTPEIAQAVWASMEKPNPNKIARVFAALGIEIGDQTIRKWQRKGWKRGISLGATNPGEVANRALDLAVPAFTGDPTTRLRDLVPAVPEPLPTRAADPRRDELEGRLDDELMRTTARSYLVMANLVIEAIEEQRSDLVQRVPAGLSMLLEGTGKAIEAGLSYYEKALQLRDRAEAMVNGTVITPPSPGYNGHYGNGAAHSADPLADSLAAWEARPRAP